MSDKSDNLSEISRKFVCKICNKYNICKIWR